MLYLYTTPILNLKSQSPRGNTALIAGLWNAVSMGVYQERIVLALIKHLNPSKRRHLYYGLIHLIRLTLRRRPPKFAPMRSKLSSAIIHPAY
jgi:hypothetical protein